MRRAPLICLGFAYIYFLSGCSSNNPDVVATVTLTPSSASLNAASELQLNAVAKDGSGHQLTTLITFNSSNSAILTVSANGIICAGVWNASFTSCSGAGAGGNPVSGQATVTASAQGITSQPAQIFVHPQVTSIIVDPVPGCTSCTQTTQLQAHVCSSFVQPHDSSGPCAPNAHEITNQVGPVTWTTTDPTVATIDTNGLVTAKAPGLTGVSAEVSSVISAATPFRVCMPIEIRLHLAGDPPGSLTTSATMTQNQSLTLETDMTDEVGFMLKNLVTVLANDSPAVANVSNTTLTATSIGGAGIVAGCTPPMCGNGFPSPFPVYSNLFSVKVPGSSPAPTVYATSSFAPPSGVSPPLVPIDTSKSPPAEGTPVNLPGVPNSLVFSANGSVAWLGTPVGLVSFTPGSGAVAVVDSSITGKVLAVSADGNVVIDSNAARDPQGNIIQPVAAKQFLWVFNATDKSTHAFVKPAAAAAAIDNDGLRDYIATNDGSGNIFVFSPQLSLQTINVAGVTGTGISPLPSDGFVYVAGSNGLNVVATCNNAQQPFTNNPPTNTTNIQLVQADDHANVVVAVDGAGVDVETATVTSILSTGPVLPFTLSPANCQPNVAYSNQFLDFGVGPITARQLLVSTNGSHIVVLAAGSANVLTAVPGASPSVTTIPLVAGATEALGGGLTPDGNTAWVGVAGTNTVDKIDLVGGSDAQQVATSFKKSDGSAAPPDLVAVQPK